MALFVKACDFLRQETGAHLEVIHHAGKDTARGARGHSLLRAATDTEIEVTAGARSPEGWATGRIAPSKQRDLEFAAPLDFTLKPVALGAPEDGIRSAVALVTPTREACTGVERGGEGDIVAMLQALVASSRATMREIGLAIGKGKDTAKRRLDAAAKDGLVERVPTGWRVTAAGRKKLAAADEAARGAYRVAEDLDEAA